MATKQELEIENKELKEKLEKSVVQNEQLVDKLKGDNNMNSIQNKIQEFRKQIRNIEFVFDKELPSNLGGGEYYSIDQFYNAVQEVSLQVGLCFKFETIDVLDFYKDLTKPSTGLPIHVATVKTLATFTDIDTGEVESYTTIAQGSDTMDKAVSGASTLAFRQWFYKNFTPKNMSEELLIKTEKPVEKSKAVKTPVYVPEKKKEEIKKQVVKQEQHENSDDEDVKMICDNIMKIREKIDNPEYGANTLKKIMSGDVSSADLLEIDLKIKNKMEKVGL